MYMGSSVCCLWDHGEIFLGGTQGLVAHLAIRVCHEFHNAMFCSQLFQIATIIHICEPVCLFSTKRL